MSKSLDEMIEQKVYNGINYVLSKFIKPDMKVKSVGSINRDMINILKEEHGIKGIILDVDDTLRSDMKDIPEVNKNWISMMKEEFKLIVVSNGVDRKIEEYFKSYGICYIGFAHKPLKKSFCKACDKLGLKPEEVLIIGNDLISDIYGGKRNNMKTLLVDSVEEVER